MRHVDRLAAQHLLTIHDPDAAGDSILSALDWIEDSPCHRMAFERVNYVMQLGEGIDPRELSRLKQSPMRQASSLFSFRRRTGALAASIMLLVIGGSALLTLHRSKTLQEARFETSPNTIRSIRLVDGSNIMLAGASAVTVRLRENVREVSLLSGEAMFSVAPDRDRPFTVQTKNGSTTAIGTAFDIHRGANDTTVTVLHGRVAVLARGSGYLSKAMLEKAMEVRYSDTGEMSAVARVDPETIASWRRREFHYSNTPLAAVVDDLNRYSARPIVLEDTSIGQIRISGVIDLKNLIEWLDALPAIADVEIIETTHDIRVLRRRERVASGA